MSNILFLSIRRWLEYQKNIKWSVKDAKGWCLALSHSKREQVIAARVDQFPCGHPWNHSLRNIIIDWQFVIIHFFLQVLPSLTKTRTIILWTHEVPRKMFFLLLHLTNLLLIIFLRYLLLNSYVQQALIIFSLLIVALDLLISLSIFLLFLFGFSFDVD